MHTVLSSRTRRPAAATLPWPIRLLRRLHPVVVALLRSPLHRLASHELLLLTYTGRRSGRSYTLPLSYVAAGDHLYLCTRPAKSDWWRNLGTDTPVTLRVRGRDTAARATVLDPASPEALAALGRFLTVNPRTGEMLYDVRRGPDGRPDAAELTRAVRHAIVVQLARHG